MKKLAVIALIAAMSLSLAACGKNNADNNNANNTNVTDTQNTQSVTDNDMQQDNDLDTEGAEDTQKPVAVDGTVGEILRDDFLAQLEDNNELTAQELATALAHNPIIPWSADTMEVEPGYLNGFGEVEITGFSEGVMFGPIIGSIPFIGYVFTLEEDTDAEQFMALLRDSADLSWNICVEADEMQMEQSGDKIFFVMCPTEFETN